MTPRSRAVSSRKQRRKRQDSISDANSSDDFEPASDNEAKRPIRHHQTGATTSTKSRKSRGSNKTRQVNKPGVITRIHTYIPSDNVKPAWATLPYQIILAILEFASWPLRDDNFRPLPSVQWLLAASRISRAFTEPALTVLYYSPPFHALDSPHKLVELLTQDAHLLINYKTKIKRLEIDARLLLSYSSPGRGHFDLGAIFPLLPQLSDVEIIDAIVDRPPYRPSANPFRWSFPSEFLSQILTTNVRLKRWRWNMNMVRVEDLIAFQEFHASPQFQNVRHLCISQFWTSEILHRLRPLEFSNTTALLKQLRSFAIESSHLPDWSVLSQLPTTLRELSIINCTQFDSTALKSLLQTHGSYIQHLTLDHNQALDLAFLGDLETSCPNLQTLKMDTTYYSALQLSNHDSNPTYTQLLDPGMVPTWPGKLQRIELLHLRKWSSVSAITFFESLLASAEKLPFLRVLIIKAIVDISWRDRAKLRDELLGKLRTAFLRQSPPPDPHLASFRTFRMSKHDSTTPTNALSRSQSDNLANDTSNPVANSGTERRSKRLSTIQAAQLGNEQEPKNEEQQISTTSTTATTGGYCHTVDISIDNHRPKEVQFTEADFLD